jgi:hypothetical protein
MIDPAIIAAIAASAANQQHQDGDEPATVMGLVLSVGVVFGLAAIVVCSCHFFVTIYPRGT